MDAVYANGVWSYVVTFEYGPLEEKPPFAAFHKGLDLLWGLVFCSLEDYPYSVYMDAYSLYFMSKDTAFPNDYIEEFNKREDMHLIYR